MLLFTSKTCVNCKPVKAYIEKHGIKNIEYIDVDDRFELAMDLKVRSIPTLIDGNTMVVGASEILKKLEV